MVNAPQLRDFYLLQFTLEGECELWQESHHNVLPARSVAIVNPGRPFRKAWMPRARQLLLRIDRGLVEREFRAWTGGDESGGIEFDMPPVDDMAKVGTLARYVRMICDDLKSEASDLSHPLVARPRGIGAGVASAGIDAAQQDACDREGGPSRRRRSSCGASSNLSRSTRATRSRSQI